MLSLDTLLSKSYNFKDGRDLHYEIEDVYTNEYRNTKHKANA